MATGERAVALRLVLLLWCTLVATLVVPKAAAHRDMLHQLDSTTIEEELADHLSVYVKDFVEWQAEDPHKATAVDKFSSFLQMDGLLRGSTNLGVPAEFDDGEDLHETVFIERLHRLAADKLAAGGHHAESASLKAHLHARRSGSGSRLAAAAAAAKEEAAEEEGCLLRSSEGSDDPSEEASEEAMEAVGNLPKNESTSVGKRIAASLRGAMKKVRAYSSNKISKSEFFAQGSWARTVAQNARAVWEALSELWANFRMVWFYVPPVMGAKFNPDVIPGLVMHCNQISTCVSKIGGVAKAVIRLVLDMVVKPILILLKKAIMAIFKGLGFLVKKLPDGASAIKAGKALGGKAAWLKSTFAAKVEYFTGSKQRKINEQAGKDLTMKSNDVAAGDTCAACELMIKFRLNNKLSMLLPAIATAGASLAFDILYVDVFTNFQPLWAPSLFKGWASACGSCRKRLLSLFKFNKPVEYNTHYFSNCNPHSVGMCMMLGKQRACTTPGPTDGPDVDSNAKWTRWRGRSGSVVDMLGSVQDPASFHNGGKVSPAAAQFCQKFKNLVTSLRRNKATDMLQCKRLDKVDDAKAGDTMTADLDVAAAVPGEGEGEGGAEEPQEDPLGRYYPLRLREGCLQVASLMQRLRMGDTGKEGQCTAFTSGDPRVLLENCKETLNCPKVQLTESGEGKVVTNEDFEALLSKWTKKIEETGMGPSILTPEDMLLGFVDELENIFARQSRAEAAAVKQAVRCQSSWQNSPAGVMSHPLWSYHCFAFDALAKGELKDLYNEWMEQRTTSENLLSNALEEDNQVNSKQPMSKIRTKLKLGGKGLSKKLNAVIASTVYDKTKKQLNELPGEEAASPREEVLLKAMRDLAMGYEIKLKGIEEELTDLTHISKGVKAASKYKRFWQFISDSWGLAERIDLKTLRVVQEIHKGQQIRVTNRERILYESQYCLWADLTNPAYMNRLHGQHAGLLGAKSFEGESALKIRPYAKLNEDTFAMSEVCQYKSKTLIECTTAREGCTDDADEEDLAALAKCTETFDECLQGDIFQTELEHTEAGLVLRLSSSAVEPVLDDKTRKQGVLDELKKLTGLAEIKVHSESSSKGDHNSASRKSLKRKKSKRDIAEKKKTGARVEAEKAKQEAEAAEKEAEAAERKADEPTTPTTPKPQKKRRTLPQIPLPGDGDGEADADGESP